jgi:hypothetical protein
VKHRSGRAVSSLALLVAIGGCSKSKDKPEGGGAPAPADPAAAPSSGEAAKAPAAGPTRAAMECGEYIKTANDAASSANLKTVIEAGTWAGTAASLQELPAGATLCGGYKMDTIATVLIKSPLFGNDLKAAYEPIMKKAGCTFKKDATTGGMTDHTWDCGKAGPVTILTERETQMYALSSTAP